MTADAPRHPSRPSPVESVLLQHLSAATVREAELVAQTHATVAELTRRRIERGMNGLDVAAQLGITPAELDALEDPDSDPPLSLVHRYAAVVGATVTITAVT